MYYILTLCQCNLKKLSRALYSHLINPNDIFIHMAINKRPTIEYFVVTSSSKLVGFVNPAMQQLLF